MSIVSLWTAALLVGVIVNLALALHAMMGIALGEELLQFVDGHRWTKRLLLLAMVLACAIGGTFLWGWVCAVDYLESRGLYRPQGKGL